MGSSRKHRQQWADLDRTEAVARLRELADRVERDGLEFAGEPTPLVMLKRVKISLRPEGDRFTVVQKLKAHALHPGAPSAEPSAAGSAAATGGVISPRAPMPPVEDLAFRPLKRTMKQHYRELHVAFRQGRLPAVEEVQWMRDAAARQQALRGHEDPAFAQFVAIAEELVDAVTRADSAAARSAWRELTGQHRACHRRRK